MFESIANVEIDGPIENKLKKLEEQKKKEEEEKRQLEEEKKRKEQEEIANKHILDIKASGKDEDKDSGLKIGEESPNDSEYEYEYTDDDYEDYYEDEEESETNYTNSDQKEKDIVLQMENLDNTCNTSGEIVVISESEAVTSETIFNDTAKDETENLCENNDKIETVEILVQEEGQEKIKAELEGLEKVDFCDIEDTGMKGMEKMDKSDLSYSDFDEDKEDFNDSQWKKSDCVTKAEEDCSFENELNEEKAVGIKAEENSTFENEINKELGLKAEESSVIEETTVVVDRTSALTCKNNSSSEEEIISSIYASKDIAENYVGLMEDQPVIDANFQSMSPASEEMKNPEEMIGNDHDLIYDVIEESCNNVESPSEPAFNKEEYIQMKTTQLEKILDSAGFKKSISMIEQVDEGKDE